MKRSTGALLAFTVLFALFALMLGTGSGLGGASSLSAGPDGLMAARLYLAERGVTTGVTNVPLNVDSTTGETWQDAVWLLSFPWSRALDEAEELALRQHLAQGGTIIAAYSRHIEGSAEIRALAALGLEIAELRKPPLWPWRWWRAERADWELEPASPGWSEDPPRLVMPAPRRAPAPAREAVVLYRGGPAAAPLVFAFERHGGKVVAVPAALLANSGLARAGNADWLESLRRWSGESWRFDEFHHGLAAPEYQAAATARFAWDLFLIHLALFYVLGLMAVARRFGPVWREPSSAAAGSAAVFLRNLGVLHGQLGHHRAAARRLDELRRQLDPRTAPLIEADSIPQNNAELVRFARRLAHHRAGTRGEE